VVALWATLPDRRVYMLDSFEGFPDPGDKDPGRAEWMAEHGRLAVASDVARAAMMRAGANDFEILEGWFDDTVPALAATRPRIAMLRLDGNLYDSTMVCLEHLGPLVVPGGAIIVNVYGDWEGTTRAMHDWLSRCGRVEPIQRTRRACVAHVIVRP
jgi:hypothetical protein